MGIVKNKEEKPKNDATVATSKDKPVSKKPAAEKAPEKKSDPVKTEDKKSAPVLTKEQEEANKRINDSHEEFIERIKAENAAKVEAQKESASVAMSTDAFSKEILTEFHKRTMAIKNNIGKIDSSFEAIAFDLYWIYAKKAFKTEGYKNIESYCEDAFGYKKSTCYSFISIVERFAKKDEKGALLEAFDDRVKGFSTSKLSLMVNLSDADIAFLKPSMSVRAIEEFIKGLSAKSLPELSEGDSEPPEDENETSDDGKTSDDGGVVDVEAVISNTLIKCEGKEDYHKKMNTIDKYIVNVFKQHPNAVISVSYSVPKETAQKE